MKVEFDVPQEVIEAVIKQAVDSFLSVSSYGEVRGSLAGPLRITVTEMASNEISRLDLSALVKEEVDHGLVQTIRQQIRKAMAAEARKAVKIAMDEKN
jgi:hypothetical protein